MSSFESKTSDIPKYSTLRKVTTDGLSIARKRLTASFGCAT